MFWRKSRLQRSTRIEKATSSVLEVLEERRLLSTFTVTTTADEVDPLGGTIGNPAGIDGKLSLREAILLSNTIGGSNTIELPAGLFKITRPNPLVSKDSWAKPVEDSLTGDFDIKSNITFAGSGDGETIISGGLDRVFEIARKGLNVTFTDLTITRGLVDGDGGGIYASCPAVNLTLNNVTVNHNQATGDGGGIFTAGGNITLTNSHVDYNKAGGEGGGIYNAGASDLGAIKLTKSTASFNIAGEEGGGIDSDSTKPLTLIDSRVECNQAGEDGGGIATASLEIKLVGSAVNSNIAGDEGDGGGIYVETETDACGTISLENSEVKGNVAGGNGGGIDAGGYRVTLVDSKVNDNVALTGGGGGIYDAVGLTLRNSHVDNNKSLDNGGGAAVFSGDVTLSSSTISGNKALYGAGGGLYYDAGGQIEITDSKVANNKALGDGGGIFAGCGAEIFIVNSEISGNRSINGSGGGLFGGRFLKIEDSGFIGNIADGGSGGGFFTTGNVILTGSVIAENEANGDYANGGGFAIVWAEGSECGPAVTISQTTVADNVASGNGGGAYIVADSVEIGSPESGNTFSGNSALGNGGGLYLKVKDLSDEVLATTSVSNHKFFDNFAKVTNSTFAFNTAQERGGGIFVADGVVKLTALTVAGNIAAKGGGVFNDDGFVCVLNSIIATNQALPDDIRIEDSGWDVYGCFFSGGYNLIGQVDDSSFGFAPHNTKNDIVGTVSEPVDPMLDDLADNGGPTQTMALLPGSPAIDAALKGITYNDQRGEGFLREDAPDIGAFELLS